MILAVDEILPWGSEAFSGIGPIRTFSGRKVGASDIRDAEALIVRSVTRVDSRLLEGTSVKFVGSATIGMDHLDEAYLKARGIHYTNAAGSNANSVAEYIVAALLVTARRRGWNLSRKSIAIIGVGHVGSKVEEKVRILGLDARLCDPPLRDSTGDSRYGSLADVLDADIITFHVPLTKDGLYPTYHMLNRSVIGRLSKRQFLINSARGSVFDGHENKEALSTGRIEGSVLDVWEGEPRIDYPLLRLVDIGTPHIAGYSLDGKVAGTAMVVEELCRHFNIEYKWDSRYIFPAPRHIRPARALSGQEALHSVVTQAYDIMGDDRDLRALESLPVEEAGRGFDALRNNYNFRPEFRHWIVDLDPEQAALADTFRSLGFQTGTPNPTARKG